MRARQSDTRQIWFWLVAIIAITSFFTFLYTPFNGDDWAYKMTFEGPNAKLDSWLSYPRWCGSHWLTTNGRIGNYLLPPLLIAPAWLRSIFCAGAIWLMYWSAVKISDTKNCFLSLSLIFLMAFGLSWWDSMTLYACQLNYIWATALVLSALLIIKSLRHPKVSALILSFIYCGAAGMGHEAASLPITGALIIWFLFTKDKPTKAQYILFIAFAIGSLLTISPNTIARGSDGRTPDDALPWLLLKSDPAVIFLWLVIAALALFPKGRKAVKDLMMSQMGIFAIAAFFSMCISGYSGIVGRSGWFAEVYAFIAIIGWIRMYAAPDRTVPSIIMSVLIIAQNIGCAVWQYRLHKDSVEFERQYVESEDGLVFLDATRDNDIPWWTLGHLRGVPDADDAFNYFAYARYYGRPDLWPVVMPVEAKGLLPLKPGDEYILGNGDILTTRMHDTKVAARYSFSEKNPLIITKINGRTMTVQKVPGGYYLAPLITDPGDRYDIKLRY